MKFLKILILLFLSFRVFPNEAQTVEPLNKEFVSTWGSVDKNLSFKTSPGYLPVGKNKLKVIYYDLINNREELVNPYGGRPVDLPLISNPKNGKKKRALIYSQPTLYYAILDLPGDQGRFYGAVTTGYDMIEEVMKNPPATWHPYTEVILIEGKVERPDGRVDDYVIIDREKIKNPKPTGTYWLLEELGYEDMKFEFNANGTGSLTCYPYGRSWTLMRLSAGSYQFRDKGQIRKRTVNNFTGGYHVWMRYNTTRAFKWIMDPDEQIVIKPYGAVTAKLEQEVSPSGDRALDAQNKADFRINIEAEYSREWYKKIAIKNMMAIDEIVIDPTYVSKTEILGNVSSKISIKEGIDFPSTAMDEWRQRVMIDDAAYVNRLTKESKETFTLFNSHKIEVYELDMSISADAVMDLPYIFFPNLDIVEDYVNKKRRKGPHPNQVRYNEMVKEMKDAIKNDKTLFEGTSCYWIGDVNPEENTATIKFVVPDKLYLVDVKFENGQMIPTKAEMDPFEGRLQELRDLNERILAARANKKNKKAVNKYEKEYSIKSPGFSEAFTNFDEIDVRMGNINDFIKYQNEVIGKLK